MDKNALKIQIKRSLIRFFILILVMSGLSYTFLQLNHQMLNSPFNKGPWITWYNDPSTTICVSWEHETPSEGIVYYKTTSESQFSDYIQDNSIARLHHLNLTGLIPNTNYEYKVYRGTLANSILFATGTFKTAPSNASENAFFALISDPQQPAFTQGGFWQTAKILEKKTYDFIGIIGDLTNDGLVQSDWNNFFHQGASLFNKTALVPVIGNHDYGSHDGGWTPSNDSMMFNYFPNAANNSARNLFYYSFNYSAVHISVCHFTYMTNFDELTGEQEAWIREDLARAQSMPFRIMLFHCPVIAGGFFGKNAILWEKLRPILYEYNISATISGHEHSYERGYYRVGDTENNIGRRVLNLVIGGAGSVLNVASRPHPDMEDVVFTVTNFYTEVKINATQMQFQTFSIEGDLIDNVVIQGGQEI